MSSMNFTCDVCGREVFSCTFVNGMKFCAKCYQETFGETDKDRKIADLEAKLAESESKRKSLEEKIKFLTEETEANFVDGQKYNQLKHQLAITEKALELACERVKYFEEMQDKEMGFYEFFGYDSDYDLKAIIEQYKQQAKEMLESDTSLQEK